MAPQPKIQECARVSPGLNFESQFKRLIYACQDKKLRRDVLKYFRYHPLLKVHDIARSFYMLTALEEGKDLSLDFLNLSQEPSGAVSLFRYGGFPWYGLPYPAEHAELGALLLRIAQFYPEIATSIEKMKEFQKALVTHEGSIFPSLWAQQRCRPLQEREKVGCAFFKDSSEYNFIDEKLGYWMKRTISSSAYVTGTGCRSGVGAYYFGDVGIASYGPIYGEIGFGISGIVKNFYGDERGASFLSSVTIPHTRKTGFTYLEDAHLGNLVGHHIYFSEQGCRVFSQLHGSSPQASYLLFCKGKSCQVVGGPKLRAASFDSYKGPSEEVIILGNESLHILSSSARMEIFALERSLWGSQFMLRFPYTKGVLSLEFVKPK